MSWELDEVFNYYEKQGVPGDQNALVSLLQEIQQEHGGRIPKYLVGITARRYSIRESLILALSRRIPRLRLEDSHCLSVCAGKNCGKHILLAETAEKLHKENPDLFKLEFVSCMRQCGKGPNIRWDGTLYHRADEALLRRLIGGKP